MIKCIKKLDIIKGTTYMMNGTITINNTDYKNIFIDIAEKLYIKHLIDSE